MRKNILTYLKKLLFFTKRELYQGLSSALRDLDTSKKSKFGVRLQQKNVKNLKALLNRNLLLDNLQKHAVCAEIGVDNGDFSKVIIDKTKPKKLHLIDVWGDPLRYSDSLKGKVIKRFQDEIEKGQIEINLGYSTQVLKRFPDNYFDWVYLDTNHTYKTTKEELRVITKKVKPQGIIAGHDYSVGNWSGNLRYGVIEAVNEYCVNYGWELVYITIDFEESASFAIRRIK